MGGEGADDDAVRLRREGGWGMSKRGAMAMEREA